MQMVSFISTDLDLTELRGYYTAQNELNNGLVQKELNFEKFTIVWSHLKLLLHKFFLK